MSRTHIIRVPKTVSVIEKDVTQNTALSYKAIGLYAQITSYEDEAVVVSPEFLAEGRKESVEEIAEILKELKGFISRVDKQV